jgi:uncharacterized protein YjbI with pentapeptide repeats
METKRREDKHEKSILSKISMNQRLLSDGVVNFLADNVQKDQGYKKLLFKIILASRDREDISIASANAITILNAARVSFSNMNLSGIKIPGASLRFGKCDRVNFSSSSSPTGTKRVTDLFGVDFSFADIEGALFEGVNLSGTIFEAGNVPNVSSAALGSCKL